MLHLVQPQTHELLEACGFAQGIIAEGVGVDADRVAASGGFVVRGEMRGGYLKNISKR
jgi:hypothetical protein